MATIPTMKVTKDGQSAIINVSDFESWEARGWQRFGGEPVSDSDKPVEKTVKARKPKDN